MVEADQEQNQGSPSKVLGDKMYNSRYVRLEEIGHGSFATVYKCFDLLSDKPGRLISDDHIKMLQEIAKESPEIEFVPNEDPDSFSEAKKAAIAELSDLTLVFPQNGVFDAEKLPESSDD